MHTDGSGDGQATCRYELLLDLVGCRRDVLGDAQSLEDFSVGLWTAAVGTVPPRTVVTRLPNSLDGYSITQMGDGCTITGRFESSVERAQIRFSSSRLLDASGAERFVQKQLRPQAVSTT